MHTRVSSYEPLSKSLSRRNVVRHALKGFHRMNRLMITLRVHSALHSPLILDIFSKGLTERCH